MATVTKKDKFFEVLRNIFVGARIEGNSGYVNLMKIKSKYYSEFKEQLHTDIDAKLKEVGQNFEEELYNKLFTFFKKYFSESGSIYFSYTPLQEKVYERIYREDKDVILFWKTHMLYYVKTERLFKNMEVEDEDIIYLFDVAELQHKKSNEKKDLVFDLVKAEHTDKRRIHFSVKYSKSGSKTKTEEIIKNIKKEKAFGTITLKQVEKAFGIFNRQSEVDYFINKDAKGFLKEQFSLWIKGYLLDDQTLFEPARLNQLKALQSIAFNIIDLVGQFEDELVKIWIKPKIVFNSNYVINIGRLSKKITDKIINHKNLSQQIKEWKDLYFVDEKFQLNESNIKNYSTLPIDTKYFKNLELDILGLYDNLNEELNGYLIHSENYQALQTIQRLYYNQIKCIYLDPPFNTGKDFDYIDGYQDTSWLSIMKDRLQISHSMLSKDGGIFIHLDRYANYFCRQLLNDVFGKENYKAELYWDTCGDTGFKTSKNNWYQNTNCILQYAKNFDTYKFNKQYTLLNVDDPKAVKEERKSKKIGWLDIQKDDAGKTFVYQYDSKGRLIRNYFDFECKVDPIGMIWTDVLSFLYTQVGNNESYFFNGGQKPEHLIARFLQSQTEPGDIVLDYFMGIGTTCAVAHKIGRKYIGVEMGEHFNTFYDSNRVGIIGRLKNVVFGDSTFSVLNPKENTISKRTPQLTRQLNWPGGGFFKYYSLEQYEETLAKIKYEDKGSLPTQDIYHQYLFLKDLKLADDVVKFDEKSKSIKVDLTKLHPEIDIPETLSHLTGKFIKQIKKDEVVFTDGTSLDLTNIDYKIVKPLIWW